MKRPVILRPVLVLSLLSLALGAALLGEWSYLQAKAFVAERLIHAALGRHLADGGAHPPWSWADHHPIARIEHVESGARRTVISGATGASMAFAVGHVHGTALPNGQGRSVVAGHRDGAFRFLGKVRRGDRFVVTSHAARQVYRVREVAVISERDLSLLDPVPGRSIALLTCYPLDSMRPGTQRLVVIAEPEPRDGAMNLPKPV
jgi:sortase A